MESIQKTLEEKLAIRPDGTVRKKLSDEEYQALRMKFISKQGLGNENCQECNGLGYVRVENKEWRSNGKPANDFLPCSCRNKEITEYKQSASGLVDSELDLTWKNVIPVDNVEEAIATIKAVLVRGFGWVYLWGGPGNAKTMLLQIAVAECLRNNQEATYTKLSKIMDNMREAYDKEYPNTEAINRMNRWTNIPILAIDELDKIRGTEYEKTQRLELFDDRYTTALRMENITLTAANVPPEDLGNDYLASRARDHRFKVINMQSPDMRPAMSWPFEN